MNSPAIDQILQVAPPARSASEPVRPTISDRPAFQDHLERASSEIPSLKSTEPVDAEYNDPNSSDRDHDTASSQEDETLKAVDSAVTDAEEDLENHELTEQDSVELSDAAVVLADPQVLPEDQTGITLAQSQTSETKSHNFEGDENNEADSQSLKTLSTENENFDDFASSEKSAISTEIKVKSSSTEKLEQQSESQTQADKSSEVINLQPTVANKTQEGSTDEEIANARKKAKSLGKTAHSSEATEKKLSTTENQATQQPPQTEIDIEALDPESPVDQKQSSRHESQQDSNLQPATIQTESKTLQEEQALLVAENRASVGTSAPTSESSSPATPVLTNLGGEATNFSPRLADASVVASADASTETEPFPTADRARFIQRVSGAIRSAQSREGEIHLQLRPPELGLLRIEIAVKQGVLTAHLETETSAARAILLDNLPALRERLAEQEIRIEKFDVDVRDEGRQQSDHPGTEDRKANRPQPESRQQPTNDQRQQATPNTPALETSLTPDGSLDVRI